MTYNRVLGQLEGNNTISSGDTMLVLAEHSRKQFVDEIWALLTSEKKQYFSNILVISYYLPAQENHIYQSITTKQLLSNTIIEEKMS